MAANLYTLPVTQSDIEALQLGIQFFSDPTQAANEAAAINAGSTTVYDYAVQLISTQISVAQVAVADSALMEGATVAAGTAPGTPNTLALFTTQFLPGQVAYGVAHGFNPTVFAAQSLGEALGNQPSFVANFVGLSAANFVASVANITGIHTNPIVGWLQYWTNFYTVNGTPSGLTVTEAAYGATFGDAVGNALLISPTLSPANQPTGLPAPPLGPPNFTTLQNQVYNALIANAEGTYTAGVALGAVTPHTTLQGEGKAAPITLTVGQDTITKQGQITVFGPLAGIFGNQATLTNGDSITDSGPGSEKSVLNATFDGSATANGLNVDAIPTWNIQQTANGTVRLSGGILGSSNTITGLTTLNYNDNGFGGSLNVGTAALPILPATGGTFDGFQLTVANADTRGFGNHDVDVSMSKTGFTAAGQAINVTADGVGNTGIIPDFDHAYGIGAGSPTVGFTTWNITSNVAGGTTLTNDLRIGADGNGSATKIVLTDDGSSTILWSAGSDVSGSTNGDWANIKDINLSGTSGFVTLTGAESGSEGLLNSDTTALVTIEGGKGNSLYDLSSLTPATVNAAAFSIAGGSGAGDSIVEFNNAAITGATHLINITHISVLNDADNAQGGTINMVNWAQQGVPGTGPGLIPLNTAFGLPAGGAAPAGFQLLQLLGADSDASTTQTANLTIENGPAQFAINAQGMGDSGDFNFSITQGPIINTASIMDVWVADSHTGSSLGGPAEVNISNYTATNVFLPTTDGIVKLGTTSFTDTPVFTVNNASLTFADNNADTGASPDTLKLGNIYGSAITGAFTDIGQASVHLDATAPTTVTDKGAGTFEIGGLDATVLNAVTTHELIMNLPGTDWATGITVTGSDVGVGGGNNLLQGTTGTLTHTVAATTPMGPLEGPAYVGAVGNDTITGGQHNDNILGMGGNDDITLHSNVVGPIGAANASTVWLNFYGEQPEGGGAPTTFLQAITDISGGVESFVNGYGTDTTTIHNFALGAAGDVLNIGPGGWARSTVGGLATGGSDFGLINANGSLWVTSGHDAALGSIITLPGSDPGAVDVTLDGISTFTSAAQLQASLTTTGNIHFWNGGIGSVPGHGVFHELVAYGTGTGVNIDDVTIVNTLGSTQPGNTNNPALTVTAHDLVDLVGTTSLGTLNAHNIFLHA